MATPSPWKILKIDSSPIKSSSFSSSSSSSSHSTLSFLIIHPNRTTLSSISPSPPSSSSATTICSAGPRKRLKKPETPITTAADHLNDAVVVSGVRIESVQRRNLSFKSLFGKRALWRRILFASTKVRSIILLNLITVIYASNIPVVKEVEAIMDPAAFTVVRFALTAIPFIPFVFRARGDVQTRNSGMELGLWVSLGYLMQALGLLTSDAGRASFLSMFTVIVVPLIDGMLGAVIPARTWFGALMSIIGVGMLECSGSPPNIGDLLNFLSAVFFGVHMLRTEHISRSTDKENFLPLLGYEVCVVALFSAAWYFVGAGGIQEFNPSSWTWTLFSDWMMAFPWIPALYTGIFSTGICLWVELAAMCDVSATETAIIYGLEPVWGAGFAWFLLGERWGISGWIGAVLVLGGSLTVQIYGASFPTLTGKQRDGAKNEENSALVAEAQNGLSAVPISVSSRKDVPNNILKKQSHQLGSKVYINDLERYNTRATMDFAITEAFDTNLI